MRALTALLLLSLALAGCSDEPPAPAADDEQTFDELGGGVTADTGLIRGIVLDPTIVPIADVTVRLLGPGLETTTNEDGAFVFSDLEPSTYFLEVEKVGYNSTQASAVVEAGVERPPIVKVQLLPNPSALPFYEEFHNKGYYTCATSAFTLCNFLDGVLCSVDNCNALDDNMVITVPIQKPPTWINSEMVWESTQVLGQNLDFYLEWVKKDDPSDWSTQRTVEGPSPLLLTVDEAEAASHDFGVTNDMRHRTFPMLTDPTSVIMIDQPWDTYTHIFYNYAPYEGWRITEDGDVPQPPS